MRPSRASIALVALLVVAASACSSGSDESADASATASATAPAASPAPASSPDAAAFTGPKKPARVTYDLSGAGEGSPSQLTVSIDPPRTAMLLKDGRLIDTGEKTILCTEQRDSAGASASEGNGPQCFILPDELAGSAGSFTSGLAGIFGLATAIQQQTQLPGLTKTGTQTIAGRQAVCASFDASAFKQGATGTAEYCADEETGIGLRYDITDDQGGHIVMEATSFGEPEPSDFEPPVEPVALPSEPAPAPSPTG